MTSSIANIPVAILAGGLATRLRPLTQSLPKALLPVAGKSFLAHQLKLLRRQGLRRAVVCVGYLGEMIEREFGDGRAFGIQLIYSYDGSALLGTGGALRKALPLLGEKFFVLYGDSYLTTPFEPVFRFFGTCKKTGLMTVYRNEGKYGTSNVAFQNGEIAIYDKTKVSPEMHHIDYGLSIFHFSAFRGRPEGKPFDLADVLKALLKNHELGGIEVQERFYEIGSIAGLLELEDKLAFVRKSNDLETGNGSNRHHALKMLDKKFME
jgi:NDP-sugar pyrophosphorylase family protein